MQTKEKKKKRNMNNEKARERFYDKQIKKASEYEHRQRFFEPRSKAKAAATATATTISATTNTTTSTIN